MGFIADFRAGFAGLPLRSGSLHDEWHDETPDDDALEMARAAVNAELTAAAEAIGDAQAESEELRAQLAEAHAANDNLSIQLRDVRADLAEAQAECDRLRGQLHTVEEEGRAAPTGDAGRIAERLWRMFAKHLHPDKAEPGETGAQALERVFKAMRADIDRFKREQAP